MIIIKLIMAHIVGDYLFQSPYIAEFKGKDHYILFVHCVLYVIPFVLIFGITWHLIPLFILHVIVDELKARHNLIPLWLDQMIHYITALVYLI